MTVFLIGVALIIIGNVGYYLVTKYYNNKKWTYKYPNQFHSLFFCEN